MLVREFLQAKIGYLPHEVFLCLYLDSRYRLIECQELFRGSITQTAVYSREILTEALTRNASARSWLTITLAATPFPAKPAKTYTNP